MRLQANFVSVTLTLGQSHKIELDLIIIAKCICGPRSRRYDRSFLKIICDLRSISVYSNIHPNTNVSIHEILTKRVLDYPVQTICITCLHIQKVAAFKIMFEIRIIQRTTMPYISGCHQYFWLNDHLNP